MSPRSCIILFTTFCLILACSAPDSFTTLRKMDSHVHLFTMDQTVAAQAAEDGFQLVTIVTASTNPQEIEKEREFSIAQHQAHSQIVHWITTFSMEGFEEPQWLSRIVAGLQKDFAHGAIAVKVWKDFGMEIRDRAGRFVMIDDSRLDSLFNFIESSGKPLVAHIGEPRNCWLPLEQMTVNNDRNYFKKHPQYHMYLHPDYPSYEAQIASRDHLLQKHPAMKVIGAHLGSLEYDVDELAKRLDRYPSFCADMSARICHFQVQERDKVRAFLEKYQDRILYATDSVFTDEQTSWSSAKQRLHETWRRDWRYLSTADEMTSNDVNGSFRGLALPRSILEKIYYTNAAKWLLQESQ
jgi:predicted TIM-barrel fold metal-dependent hydrolase